jgi:hypothetical protein
VPPDDGSGDKDGDDIALLMTRAVAIQARLRATSPASDSADDAAADAAVVHELCALVARMRTSTITTTPTASGALSQPVAASSTDAQHSLAGRSNSSPATTTAKSATLKASSPSTCLVAWTPRRHYRRIKEMNAAEKSRRRKHANSNLSAAPLPLSTRHFAFQTIGMPSLPTHIN